MQLRRIGLALGILALIAAVTVILVRPGPGPVTATGDNSITAPDTTDDVGHYNSVALDEYGYPVVSYYDVTNADLKVMHCNDVNCSGDNESITFPDPDADIGEYTSLALDSSGYPVVSYRDDTDGELKVLHCNDANCSGDNESITSPDAGNVGTSTSLVLDGNGYPVVSYQDNFNEDLKVMHCNDANCSGGGESITSPDTSLGNYDLFTSLALDSSGYPVVSYYDSTNADLKVLHCNDVNCSGDNESIQSPDTGGNDNVGGSTSLALDASGYPVVSYWDLTNEDLKVMHCNDANCSGDNESITSPDTSDNAGAWTSLALDSAGNPVVSYYYNGDVNMLHCGNANCTSGNSITSPETTGNAWARSLVLDCADFDPSVRRCISFSGNPVVSYYDSSTGGNGDLKVLHCTNANCAAKPPTPIPTLTDVPTVPAPTPTEGPPPPDPCPASPNLPFPDPGCESYDVGFSLTASMTDPVVFTSTCTGTGSLMAYRELDPVSTPHDEDEDNLRDMPVEILAGNGVGICETDLDPPLNTLQIFIEISDAPSTTGQIEEQEKGGGFFPANSSFNAYFDIFSPTLGRVLSNSAPFLMECKITGIIGIPAVGCVYTLNTGGGGGAAPGAASGGIALLNDLATPVGDVKSLGIDLVSEDTDGDFDDDGCSDADELQTEVGSEEQCGRRDYTNPWDYFNPTGDGRNRIDDVLLVIAEYRNDDPPNTDYVDRTYVGPNAWDLGPPNGQIRIDDVLNIIAQYRHDSY